LKSFSFLHKLHSLKENWISGACMSYVFKLKAEVSLTVSIVQFISEKACVSCSVLLSVVYSYNWPVPAMK